MKIEKILEEFERNKNPENIKGMQRFGIDPKKVFGLKIPFLRKMAKKLKKNHELALQLWELGYRETMILASMIDDPTLVTENQIEKWFLSPYYSYWEVVDQTCMNLLYLTDFAYTKAYEWSKREEEFVKRTAFSLIAVLAWKDKLAEDEKLESFLPTIKQESTDERNNVKKAVNWALRQIGKRNSNLNSKALKFAKEILDIDSKSAKWIARDAIKELESEAVQNRLKKTKNECLND